MKTTNHDDDIRRPGNRITFCLQILIACDTGRGRAP